MTTKPEGPAHEPPEHLFFVGSVEDGNCVRCGKHKDDVAGLPCTRQPKVPATPAPSQPAGAREWDDDPTPQELMAAYDRVCKERDELKQQTAVKDAELAKWRDEAALRNAGEEAAERERDSLREANARLAADLDAALKAEKDGSDVTRVP